MKKKENSISIIGAGLVGSLLSIYLVRRGFEVKVFERRSDLRRGGADGGRSINLACSDRGWNALREVGIADEVEKIAIPMRGRMTHDMDGKTNFLPYGKEGQAIYSVSRGGLNTMLINRAEKTGAKIYFNRRLSNISFKDSTLAFINTLTGEEEHIVSAPVFGTDGAYSVARLQLQLQTDRFEYSQHFIDYGYKELHIPPLKGNKFAMEKNCLHIWPRGKFMMIALPNMDASFTVTLFLPFEGIESFGSLRDKDDVLNYFNETFHDAVPLMPNLTEIFFNNPTSSLPTIRCYPWSHEDKLLLLGDAAHGIVPFYGQGMICGFEDCSVLDKIIESCSKGTDGKVNWKNVFEEVQQSRKLNSDAIAELALSNFIEMRDLVMHPGFILQKKIESWFSARHPELWTPLYSMVTFSHLPYSYVLEKGKIQDNIMKEILVIPGIEDKWNSEEVERAIINALTHNT